MMELILIVSLLLLVTIGIPIGYAIGMSSLIAMIYAGRTGFMLIPQLMVGGADSFALLAAPFFILSGEIMVRTGFVDHILRMANRLLGHISGGLAHVVIFASMVMAGVSGSATADASAIGSVMIPAMVKNGYDREYSVMVTASASIIGPIIPPSIIMIVYGAATNLSVGVLFLAGFVPGVMIGLMLMGTAYLYTRRDPKYCGTTGYQESFNLHSLLSSLPMGIPALIMPAIIVGGIVTGIFSPTESGAVAILYGLLVSYIYYRKKLTLSEYIDIVITSSKITAQVMLIIVSARMWGWLLVMAGSPQKLVAWLTSINASPFAVLWLIILFFFLLGIVMDALAAAIIIAPFLQALSPFLHIHPIHFAMIAIITLLIGTLTPPVCTVLSITCAIGRTTLDKVAKYLPVFLGVLLFAVLLIVIFPQTVLFVPRIFLPDAVK